MPTTLTSALRQTTRPQPDRVTVTICGWTIREYNVPTPAQAVQMWVAVAPLVGMLLVADAAAQETK